MHLIGPSWYKKAERDILKYGTWAVVALLLALIAVPAFFLCKILTTHGEERKKYLVAGTVWAVYMWMP